MYLNRCFPESSQLISGAEWICREKRQTHSATYLLSPYPVPIEYFDCRMMVSGYGSSAESQNWATANDDVNTNLKEEKFGPWRARSMRFRTPLMCGSKEASGRRKLSFQEVCMINVTDC